MKDFLNILKSQFPFRFLNSAKLYASFWWSKLVKKPVVWGMPMALSIEPTTACNLGCPECPSGLKQFSRPTGNLKSTINEKIIKELKGSVSYINFYFQGEPYINKDIHNMIRLAADNNIYTSTSTNAHFITQESAEEIVKSGLHRLIISIDGTTQDTYEQYRINGSLDKVIAGSKEMVAAKKRLKSGTPHLIFQFLVVKPNEHQTEDVKRLASDLEIDEVRFKTAQVYDYKNGNPLIPNNEKFSRYKRNADGTFSLKNKMYDHCWRMWSSAVVTWDGRVVPCCFDKDATHQMGQLSFIKFKDIWKNDNYQNFRSQILKNRQGIDICNNCSEGSKVWA